MIVSVIIPVYKAEVYLDRCIASVVNQTYRDVEIILVDDGSPDRCPQICDEWDRKDNRIRVIHQLNSGPGIARDVGIQLSTGEFVAFLDSDDWLELNAIERLVTEQIRTCADVVWGRALMHSPDGIVELSEPYYHDKHEWILCYAKLTGNIVMVCWRRIIRRTLLVNHKIHAVEGCNYAEDKVQMTQIAYYAKSFSYIDDIVYHYNRLNTNSLTAQDRKPSFNIEVFQQEMGSILWIEQFYSDKEEEYRKEITKAKLKHLKNRLESTIALKSPKGYQAVKRMIDETNPAFYNFIDMAGMKNRIVYYNYYTVMGYRWIATKIYRLIHSN